jgi:hypothetical protein
MYSSRLEKRIVQSHITVMRLDRTFDKLIATIHTRRTAGSLRSPFGAMTARCSGFSKAVIRTPSQEAWSRSETR